MSSSRFWYGWVITGAAAALAGVSMSSQLFVNVLLDSWAAEFGWGRGTAALSHSFFWLIIGFLSVPVGWLAGRYGMRRLALLGAGLFAVGTFSMGTMHQVWELYLYNGVLLGVSAAIFFGPLFPYVTQWSEQRMRLMVAIVTVGQVAGGAIFPPVLRLLESAVGWRNALYVLAAAQGLAMLAAASLLRSPPAYPRAGEVANSIGIPPPLTAGAALRKHWRGRVFWGLSAGHFLGCVAHAGILVHLISIGTWRGIPAVAATSVLALMMGTSAIGRFVFPVGSGRLGPRGSVAVIQVGQTVGLLVLFWAKDLLGFYLFALVFGLFFGGEFPIFPVLTRLYYGGKTPVEGLFGGVTAFSGIGMAFGAWVMGALFDATGTYFWGIIVAVAAGAIGSLAVVVLPKGNPYGKLHRAGGLRDRGCGSDLAIGVDDQSNTYEAPPVKPKDWDL